MQEQVMEKEVLNENRLHRGSIATNCALRFYLFKKFVLDVVIMQLVT